MTSVLMERGGFHTVAKNKNSKRILKDWRRDVPSHDVPDATPSECNKWQTIGG
jgi:hypothetical protein